MISLSRSDDSATPHNSSSETRNTDGRKTLETAVETAVQSDIQITVGTTNSRKRMETAGLTSLSRDIIVSWWQ